MYHLHLINPAGKKEVSSHTSSMEQALELLKSAMKTMKTLPPGAKIEIEYEQERPGATGQGGER